MKKFCTKEGDIVISSDLLKEIGIGEIYTIEDALFFIKEAITNYNPLFKIIFNSKFVVIDAHGDCDEKNRWIIYDGKKKLLLDNYLKKFDGKYEYIILFVCNPGACDLKPLKHSIIMLADRPISMRDICAYEISLTLLKPDGEEVDEYTLEEFIKSKNPL